MRRPGGSTGGPQVNAKRARYPSSIFRLLRTLVSMAKRLHGSRPIGPPCPSQSASPLRAGSRRQPGGGRAVSLAAVAPSAWRLSGGARQGPYRDLGQRRVACRGPHARHAVQRLPQQSQQRGQLGTLVLDVAALNLRGVPEDCQVELVGLVGRLLPYLLREDR